MIIAKEKIQTQAIAAAAKYVDLNHACPYPFDTEAAVIFEQAFKAEKQRLKAVQIDAVLEEHINMEAALRVKQGLLETTTAELNHAAV